MSRCHQRPTAATNRVVFIAEDLSAVAGGVPAVVRQLSRRIVEQRIDVDVVYAMGGAEDLPDSVSTIACPPDGLGRGWGWGKRLRSTLGSVAKRRKTETSSPVFHIHGIWAAPQYFAARAAHRNNLPFIVSAHGMLEPWLWHRQGWRTRVKKNLYWHGMAYPVLSRAAVIHAITPLERDHLRVLFPRSRIEVIPNAIDVAQEGCTSNSEREPTILFLGRIEPKKGVDLLIEAFARANLSSEWRIRVVGPVWSDSYQRRLEELVRRLRLTERVMFLGPVFGDAKRSLLRRSWVMAVPSHSEVVGLVNLEAAIVYLPTITTPQTGLYDWESGGGVLVEPNIEHLSRALSQACEWSAEEQAERGRASRRLVAERYSWEAVLPQWLSLYRSLFGVGS